MTEYLYSESLPQLMQVFKSSHYFYKYGFFNNLSDERFKNLIMIPNMYQ